MVAQMTEVVGGAALITLSSEGGPWARAGDVMEWIVFGLFAISILAVVGFLVRVIVRAGRATVGFVVVMAALGVAFALLVPAEARADALAGGWRLARTPFTIGTHWDDFDEGYLVGATVALLASAIAEGGILAGLALMLTRKGRVAVTAGVIGIAVAGASFALGRLL